MQKVRNKSSSTTSSSSSSSSSACSSSTSSASVTPNEINIICNNANLTALNSHHSQNQSQSHAYSSDLTDHDSSEAAHVNLITKNHSFCHKYSADDINHLNVDANPSESPAILPPAAAAKASTVTSCLSSSSSSSSSSSTSSSSCVPVNISIDPASSSSSSSKSALITPTKNQHVAYIVNNSNSNSAPPLKIDPKSLRLGGRPQSICSSLSASPVPQIAAGQMANSRVVLCKQTTQNQAWVIESTSILV